MYDINFLIKKYIIMENKKIKINPPEGYEIDKVNSTFEEIVFKKIRTKMPDSWEDIEHLDGWYVNTNSEIWKTINPVIDRSNRNVCSTKKIAQAQIAISQLSFLRDIARNGWKPDWNSHDYSKWCISFYMDKPIIEDYFNYLHFLSFETKEIAEEFLKKYKDPIITAKPILGD